MREESHLDEMRSAIRGDFERLAERRGEQELMRVEDDGPSEDPVQLVESHVASESVEPEAAPEIEHELDPRSWLARLFSAP